MTGNGKTKTVRVWIVTSGLSGCYMPESVTAFRTRRDAEGDMYDEKLRWHDDYHDRPDLSILGSYRKGYYTVERGIHCIDWEIRLECEYHTIDASEDVDHYIDCLNEGHL